MSALVTPGNLGPEFLIGTGVAADKIEIKVDGTTALRAVDGTLSAPSGSLTYDGVTTILTYDNGAGGTQNIDLSAFTTDLYITGGSFDAASSVLTLTDADAGTPDVTIDLSTLLGASTDADNLLTNGADGKPKITEGDIEAVVVPSTDAGNLIGTGADGKLVLTEAQISAGLTACTDAFGVDIFKAFPA